MRLFLLFSRHHRSIAHLSAHRNIVMAASVSVDARCRRRPEKFVVRSRVIMQKSQIIIVNSNNNNNRCVVCSLLGYLFRFQLRVREFVCDVFRPSNFIGRDSAVQDVCSVLYANVR